MTYSGLGNFSPEEKRKVLTELLKKTGRSKRFPVSFWQERLWFADQLHPNGIGYNVPGAVRVRGAFLIDILERVINEIIRRHEVLRTTFDDTPEGPVQIVHEHRRRRLPVTDLSGLSEADRSTEARRLLGEESRRPFDLRRGPLVRTRILRVMETDHIILYTFHHIASDGWSIGVLNHEIGHLYAAFSNGRAPSLPDLPIQYGDYAVWQRQRFQGAVLEEQLEHWRNRLAGLSALELATDRPRPAVQTTTGAACEIAINPEVAAGLRALGRQEGVTMFMMLLAGLQVLLNRYTGQDDVAIGSLIANRRQSETERLIGFFVNTLVMRANLRGNPTVTELLRKAKEATLEANEHQDLPFAKIVEELKPERDLSRNPLVQVLLQVLNAPDEGLQISGMTLEPVGGAEMTTRMDLEFHFWEQKEQLRGTVNYNRDLFEAETVQRMIGHLERVLVEFVGHPGRRIGELSLLTETERAEMMRSKSWREYRADKSIHRVFEEQVARGPEATVVVCGEERLSYGQLNSRANKLARRLRREGVGPEVKVGLCVERSLELVVGMLGILKAGGAYVPLDRANPQERLGYIIEDAQPALVLSDGEGGDGLEDSGVKVMRLDLGWEEMEGEEGGNPGWEGDPDNLAYVIYTSGSTGRPKGALVTHRNVVRLFEATEEKFGFGRQDVWTLFHSHAFDFSVWEIWGALLYGGRLVVVPYLVSRSPESFYELLEKESVTVLNQTPSAFWSLAGVEKVMKGEGKLALRVVIFGGEALNVGGLRGWWERHGTERPQMVNMYGITETTVHVTYEALGWEHLEGGSWIGRELADLRVYLLDGHGQPVPVGVLGEIHVGGGGLARGYHRKADLTAERFVPDPYGTAGSRMYRSGDLGRYRSNGALEYLGRADQQVKIRGHRIELGEIESVLSDHPLVKQNVVVMRQESDGQKRLVGYVVANEKVGHAPEGREFLAEIRKHLKQKLPEYMVPAALVRMEDLPLTPNGKVDRRGLPEPERSREEEGSRYVEPRTTVEKKLSEIWSALLGLEHVGVEDNFFECGGHSLLATQMISRIRDRFGVALPLRTLFELPTIAEIGGKVEELASSGINCAAEPLQKALRQTFMPASYAQERLWFIDQLQPGNPAYNVPGLKHIRGIAPVQVLESVVNEIVRRHEVLRTSFKPSVGGPVQVIHAHRWERLPVIDLTGMEDPEKMMTALRLLQEERERAFDLTRAPLVRVLLVQLRPNEQVVFYTIHHIAADGWSISLLNREIEELFQAFVQGRPSPLPDPEFHYADYAVWQRKWLAGDDLERQLAHWKKELAGLSDVALIETDYPRQSRRAPIGKMRSQLLPPALASAVYALTQETAGTLFMTMLAAFKVLLYRLANRTDIAVGTDIANRNHLGTEAVVGFFVNQLVLRTDLSGDPTFRELLARVRTGTLKAYDHQDLPFEKLVDALRPSRSVPQTPLFQVKFILNHAADGGSEEPPPGLRELDDPQAKSDLALYVLESGRDVFLNWSYKGELFKTATVGRIADQFEALLQRIVSKPEARLSELRMLTEEERAKQLPRPVSNSPRQTRRKPVALQNGNK